MRTLALVAALAACSSAPPPPPVASPSPATDEATDEAAVPPPPVDPEAEKKAAALATTPHVFRFASSARTETWSLHVASGYAVLDVAPAGGAPTQYLGSATGSDPLVVEVATATAKMKLSCKPSERRVELPCDPSAPPPPPKASKKTPTKKPAQKDGPLTRTLECFHADFAEPMPFAEAPGIVYVAEGACAGYRTIAEAP